MSKSYKKRSKWFDDEWDVNNNSHKINKERRLRRDRKEKEAYDRRPPRRGSVEACVDANDARAA